MKLFSFLLGVLLLWNDCSVEPATINGRFVIVNAHASKTSVLLQINTDAGNAKLGGATIVFEFNTSAISINQNPVQDVDYTFHNFSGGNYSTATITRPMENTIWVNIDLPFTNSNSGTTVSTNPEWTKIVTIHFNTVDLNETQNLNWLALRRRGRVFVFDSIGPAVSAGAVVAAEHVQVMGKAAERLGPRLLPTAGALFIGSASATAFGDYVAGPNHVLPTGGAARGFSGLSLRDFIRWGRSISMSPAAVRRSAEPRPRSRASRGSRRTSAP